MLLLPFRNLLPLALQYKREAFEKETMCEKLARVPCQRIVGFSSTEFLVDLYLRVDFVKESVTSHKKRGEKW